ncbi:DUF4097 family beta strand repeat protein [bacterium]|nr:DUF4097 family beta strand repeat protein [bacterium]
MEKFLKELRDALEKIDGVDVDSIIDKYKEHFSLGHEAGMTDEEIIERFDSIDDIIQSFQSSEEEQPQTEQGFSLTLDVSQFSDFKIENSDKPFGIQFKLDEDSTKYVEVIRNGKEIHLKSKFKDSLGLPHHFEGIAYIGYQEKIENFNATAVNCDMEFGCRMKCESFSLTIISGDVSNLDVHAEEKIYINSVNGDLTIVNLITKNLQLSTVNGDMKVEEVVCDQIKLSTVNGDIHIKNSNSAPYTINTVSGDVVIDSGVRPEDVKVSTVSGKVTVEGISVGKSLAEKLRNKFKF